MSDDYDGMLDELRKLTSETPDWSLGYTAREWSKIWGLSEHQARRNIFLGIENGLWERNKSRRDRPQAGMLTVPVYRRKGSPPEGPPA